LSEVPHSQYEPSLHGCGCEKTPALVTLFSTPSMQYVAGRHGNGRNCVSASAMGDARSSDPMSSALSGSGVSVFCRQ
jgi:hypothetical protein